MKFYVAFLIALLTYVQALTPIEFQVNAAIRQEIIDTVNSNPEATWKAGINENLIDMTNKDIAHLCGVRAGGPILEQVTVNKKFVAPESFDARDKWSYCPSMDEIRDQSACGSCWAFGAVSAATDRWCIASQGKSTPHFSARDVLSCCGSCGMGCNGGYPSAAWSWMSSVGVVTGGNYMNYTSCVSYPLQLCEHHTSGSYKPCASLEYDTPKCTQTCDAESTYQTPYSQDKHKFAYPKSVSGEAAMMQEIMTNGPIEVAFSVYADFPTYKSGVYQHVTGEYLGGHAVKALGWGIENGVKYWLIANSWNTHWGDKGYFKILRGSNHCGIEGSGVAGIPQL